MKCMYMYHGKNIFRYILILGEVHLRQMKFGKYMSLSGGPLNFVVRKRVPNYSARFEFMCSLIGSDVQAGSVGLFVHTPVVLRISSAGSKCVHVCAAYCSTVKVHCTCTYIHVYLSMFIHCRTQCYYSLLNTNIHANMCAHTRSKKISNTSRAL